MVKETNTQSTKQLKDRKLRHAEYYGMTSVYDDLYQKAKNGQKFDNLMPIILSDDNILLAYRNIKRNKGSQTAAIDGINIEDIEHIEPKQFIYEVRKRFYNYQPGIVRRKEIPKPNGKTRPLGIPSIWDRIIQQCILQVMEPICEAKFNTRSYGFRPNRSAENAIADCVRKINRQKLYFVVDVDIKGFFDEVNHVKLMRQLWTMGFRDKQLLVIIRKILKAPIKLENGEIVYPQKGTPQGGILSPLLANINLNEFDWWISEQWETFNAKNVKPYLKKDILCYGNVARSLRNSSKLKPMYIVRYADDFKIFTNTRSNAEKIFNACQMWLKERLRLPISEEKSKITNLKKHKSEFLGFTLKAVKKGKDKKGQTQRVAETHIAPKALKKMKNDLKAQIKRIQKTPNSKQTLKEIGKYNSMVIGKHNYYKIATCVAMDVSKIAQDLMKCMYNRFPKVIRRNKENPNGFTSKGHYKGKDKGILPYMKSEQVRYLMKVPIIPLAYVQCKNPMMKKQSVNKYTEEGRTEIHKKLKDISEAELKYIREHPILGKRASVEYNDNRISLYVAQKGKCSVTGQRLAPWEIHCHHKTPWHKTKNDTYKNLIIIHPEIHKLIHATKEKTIKEILEKYKLDKKQMEKLNKLRKLADNKEICIQN